MSFHFIFWLDLLVLIAAIVYCDRRFYLLRDVTQTYKPYSWARVQLAWWTAIILASFTAILFSTGEIPTFNTSTLILLGISAATTATARLIDLNEKSSEVVNRENTQAHFIVDILSDEFNINMHRFQTVVFNLIFGVYFIRYVVTHFDPARINEVMPLIPDNNLILLGLSSATYAALKTTENKTKEKAAVSEVETTESLMGEEEPAVG